MNGSFGVFLTNFLSSALAFCMSLGGKLIWAGLIFLAGYLLARFVGKLLGKSKGFSKLDSAVQSFTNSFVKIAIWTITAVCVVAVLGVPVSSLIAVISAAGLAIGLALQGALSNFAGGIMILVFRPFGIGDYVSAAGAEGSVKEITVFYTKLITPDNKLITVPNGSLMNANVTNFSSEPTRRVDIPVTVAFGTDTAVVTDVMLAAAADPRVIAEPAPAVVQTNATDLGREITLRVWCNNEDYWAVRFDVTERVFVGLSEKNIKPATSRVSVVAER
ncbi:MAG: mechanosensitive ion channel family protein [Clostridia bacterium]|nr:mechanosensitive ion channel family protein [Clostridia bacterium]